MALDTYDRHVWETGELITADKMNNIESFLVGIQENFVNNSSDGADVAGQLRFPNSTNNSFYKGRDIAAIKVNVDDSTGGKYFAINSIKSQSGSWEIGIYNDRLVFNFISDTDYEANRNNYRQFILTSGATTTLWEDNPFEIITSENWTKYIHLDSTIQADNINAQSINTGTFNIYKFTWPGLSFKESIGSASWASINYHTGSRPPDGTGPVNGSRYIYFTHWAPGGNQTSSATAYDRDVYYLPAGPTEPAGDHWYAILTTKNNVLSATAYFSREGDNSSYVNGRDHAFLRQTKKDSNYRAIISSKTTDGSWEIATYSGRLEFVYVSETNYQAWVDDHSQNGHAAWTLSQDGVFSGKSRGIITSQADGYYTDNYGNFKHQSSTSTNTWNIQSNAGANKFAVNFENGNTSVAGTLTVSGATAINNTLTANTYLTGDGNYKIKSDSTSPLWPVQVSNTSNKTRVAVANDSSNRIYFVEYKTAGETGNREDYRLPTPTNTSGSQANYDILTSKNAVLIEQGGTGAKTRLAAVKALTNEEVTSPNYFLTITTSWGKAGYTTIANVKTALGLSNYLPLTGGTISGTITVQGSSNGYSLYAVHGMTCADYDDSYFIKRMSDGSKFIVTGATTSNAFRAGMAIAGASSNRIYFRAHKTSGSAYGDVYYLPIPTNTSTTADASYDILTTKTLHVQSTQLAGASSAGGSDGGTVTWYWKGNSALFYCKRNSTYIMGLVDVWNDSYVTIASGGSNLPSISVKGEEKKIWFKNKLGGGLVCTLISTPQS